MKQAICYVRFSTTEQREGASLDRQRERTAAMCQARGWDVEKFIADEGLSGFKGKHRDSGAAFATFEAEARAGIHAGKVFVVEKLSRFSRQNPHTSYDVMRSLVDNGVILAVWDGDRTYESIDQIGFMETIEFFLKTKLANQESEEKADFSRDKWARRRADARAGKIITKNTVPWVIANPGGPYPLGDDRRWSIVGEGTPDDRAAIIRRIFAEADAGDGSMRITKRLNREGVKPWPRYAGRTPKMWDRKFVVRILSNPAVIGDYVMNIEDEDGKPVPDGEPVRGYYPRIIDPALFERVNASAPDRKAAMGGRKSVVANLVSGLAFCGTCRSKMEYVRCRAEGTVIVRKGVAQAPLPQETAFLYCRSNNRGGGCSNNAGIAYISLEKALLNSTLHLALDDASFSRTDEIGRLTILIADRRRDHDAASSTAKALWEGYAKSQSDMAMKLAIEAEQKAAAIFAEIETLNEAKAKASGSASAAEHLTRLAEVRKHLHHPDMEVRKTHRLKVAAGFTAIIDKIVCRKGEAEVHFIGDARLMLIRPQRGRREPIVDILDMVHPKRPLWSGASQTEKALVRRIKEARDQAA